MDWVKKLGIKHFRGIYSRDGLPKKIRKECGIINLDDMTGPGTHWVCYRNIDNVVEYFDPFGLRMPNEAFGIFVRLENALFTQWMKYKIAILFYVDIGACTISLKDNEVLVF